MKDEIVNFLGQVENDLAMVKESPSKTMLDALCPFMSSHVKFVFEAQQTKVSSI